jgi:hypothetical protein
MFRFARYAALKDMANEVPEIETEEDEEEPEEEE